MRRLLTVPRTAQAMERLDHDQAAPEELVEVRLSEQQGKELWECGVLDELNLTLHKLIDDYEDEEIKAPAELARAREIIERHLAQRGGSEALRLLLEQVKQALRLGTGLFLYF